MEKWNNKILLVLAVAGGAIGIGNFLRFPTLFAQYGGWFLIPYFISFVLLGLPLMFTEWILGTYSRDYNKNSLPTFLEARLNKGWLKFLGAIPVAACIIITSYYIFIESWFLGYGVIAAKNGFANIAESDMGNLLGQYMSFGDGSYDILCFVCLLVTIFLNYYFTAKGIAKGISKLIQVSMPLLIIMALAMLVKVLCFTPGAFEGVKYMFRGTPTDLLNSKMWIDAASQMFFSLSVGFTATYTYVTYADKNLNIFKQGLTASFMNLGMEVLIASFIAIPMSYVAFGADKIQDVVNSSSIAFGLVSMPVVFQNIPAGMFWACIWFLLLFISALTSSMSIIQPSASFFVNKLNTNKFWAALITLAIMIITLIPACYLSVGIDEFDFWANSFLVPLGALVMIIVVHMIGRQKCWDKFNENSSTPLPKITRVLISYITPIFLLVVIGLYIAQNGVDLIMCKGVEADKIGEVITCRILMGVVVVIYGVIACIKSREKKA